MLLNKSKILLFLLGIVATTTVNAQVYNSIWHKAASNYAGINGSPALKPERFVTLTTNEESLRSFLALTPQDANKPLTIDLPTPDGGFRSFHIWSTPAMEEALAVKYPGIATYTAEAVGNSSITAKIDYTSYGFHAMVFNGNNSYLIDPYTGSATGAYIVYYKKDYSRSPGIHMACEVGDNAREGANGILDGSGLPEVANRLSGTTRRSYRLALAADSEYCVAVAGVGATKAAVLAKMVTSVNRVNGVYERELAVTMVLVANEDTLIFLGPDPYTNNSGGTMLTENQTTVTTRIGSANYDIGHVFSTGGGGIAQQGCVCQNTAKARGVTGSPNPVGDAFDIDYVVHEMGHQFGAGHTFNANTGSCSGNGVASIAYEPGSGSTIMAYAGICGGGNDYQGHSDAYFHSASLEQISTFIAGSGGGCAVSTTSTNTNASLPAFAATYKIPYLTPFELTAPLATDATADTLTYCWEQRDLGDFRKNFAQTFLAGPIFRSYPPTTSRTRIFPELTRILFALPPVGEKYPDTARNLTFRLTERDIYQGWGTFNFPDDAITLNVIATPGAFTVNSPVSTDNWLGGTNSTVTWSTANTNIAPISCSAVDIYLSTDGGFTFPYLLKSGTPNDGSESVYIPNMATTSTARIKVKGSGNVFFNICAGDFTILYNPLAVTTTKGAGLVQISPIPAQNTLNIDAPASVGVLKVRIVNPVGQSVWNGDVRGHSSVPVASWAKGIYYVQIIGDGFKDTRTITVD